MSREILTAYFDEVERQLLALPNIHVEQFSITILTPERANLKLRVRFKGKYLLAVSEAIIAIDDRISQIDYRYHFQMEMRWHSQIGQSPGQDFAFRKTTEMAGIKNRSNFGKNTDPQNMRI